MAAVILVTSASGGVGKTFVTAGLGGALAGKRNVLLLDACLGWPGLDLPLGLEKSVVYDLPDVLEGSCTIAEALKEVPGHPNLYFLPAPRTAEKERLSPERVEKLIGLFLKKFDLIVVDMPREKTAISEVLYTLASRIFLVTNGAPSDMRNLKRLIGQLPEKTRKNLIVNKVYPDLIREGDALSLEDIVSELGIPLLGAVRMDTEIMLRCEEGSLLKVSDDLLLKPFENMVARLSGREIPVDLRGKK